MAETTRRQSGEVLRSRVPNSHERFYGGEGTSSAVQRLRSMVEQLQIQASRSVAWKQREPSGSDSPAVRSVLGRLSRCRSGFASAEEIAAALGKQRKLIDQLRKETILYETHLRNMTASKGSVNTNGDGEQTKSQPTSNSLDQRSTCMEKEDMKKNDIIDRNGDVMYSHFQPPANLHTQAVSVQERSQLPNRQGICRDSGRDGWPEARAIAQLQREKNDALELCSALQDSLARFHRQEHEAQIRMKQALDSIQKADDFKEMAEKNQRELLEQMEQLKVVHQEQVRSIEMSYQKKLEGNLHEQQSQIDYLNQKLSETAEEVEGLNRQLEISQKEIEQERKKTSRSEEKRKQDYQHLRDEMSQLEAKHKRESELKDAKIEEITGTSKLQSKQQQTLEEQLEVLQVRLQRYEKECAVAQDKSCLLQERVGSLQKQLGETERQNTVLLEKLNAAGEENKDLERNVHSLQLQLHKTRVQAEGSFGELEGRVVEQKELAAKWKRESELLADQLQETTARLQQQWKLEQTALQEEIEQLKRKLTESQSQCIRHGAVHQEMQQLLRETDQRAITSQKQVLVLLARQKNLMEERQSLCFKLKQLQQHVMEHNASESLPT